jgi:hypothetical protein
LGYRRIQGEALQLGFKISHMGVAKILRRQRIPPAPAALAIALGALAAPGRGWQAVAAEQ